MIDKIKELFPPSTDFCTLEYDCAYLPNKKVRMNYKYTSKANVVFNSSLIKRGWRRFGNYYFYPICNGCNECKSLRIDINSFKPSKSQRKAINKNANTKIVVQKPTLCQSRIELYNKYHIWKAKKDNWRSKPIGSNEYYENFVDGAHEFGKEILYYIDDKLVGVDLIDIVDDGISAIYFYYDPDYTKYSLGIFSLIKQVELAKILGKNWIYLGYWVDGCKAFAYKTNFKPLEILDGFPDINISPDWEEFK